MFCPLRATVVLLTLTLKITVYSLRNTRPLVGPPVAYYSISSRSRFVSGGPWLGLAWFGLLRSASHLAHPAELVPLGTSLRPQSRFVTLVITTDVH